MERINIEKVKRLMEEKYKAEEIDKQKFKQLLYGFNREDLSNEIQELTEGIIKTENAVFYLVNDVKVLNNNCKCVSEQMYPNGKVLPLPTSMFYPYILLVLETTPDGQKVINYAKWGSFEDNIDEELQKIELEKDIDC